MEYRTLIKEYPNGGKDILHIPILTPEQELERQKRIAEAAQPMLKEMEALGLLRNSKEEADRIVEERRKKQKEWLKTCIEVTDREERA